MGGAYMKALQEVRGAGFQAEQERIDAEKVEAEIGERLLNVAIEDPRTYGAIYEDLTSSSRCPKSLPHSPLRMIPSCRTS